MKSKLSLFDQVYLGLSSTKDSEVSSINKHVIINNRPPKPNYTVNQPARKTNHNFKETP